MQGINLKVGEIRVRCMFCKEGTVPVTNPHCTIPICETCREILSGIIAERIVEAEKNKIESCKTYEDVVKREG